MALTNAQTVALDKKIRNEYKKISIGQPLNHKLLVCKEEMIKIQKNGSVVMEYEGGGIIKIPKSNILKVGKNTATVVDGYVLILVKTKPSPPVFGIKISPQCTPGGGSTCFTGFITEFTAFTPLPVPTRIPDLRDPGLDGINSNNPIEIGLLRGHQP